MPPLVWPCLVSAGASNFHLGDYSPGGLGMEVPSGVQRRKPVSSCVCGHCLRILTAETIKIWKCCTVHLLILDQYVSRWGLSNIWRPPLCLVLSWPWAVTFWPQKSNQFIFVFKCTEIVNMVKFPPRFIKIIVFTNFRDASVHGRMDRLKIQCLQHRSNGGGGGDMKRFEKGKQEISIT